MKKSICFLLIALLVISLCACTEQGDTENETTSAESESVAGAESSEETASSESEASAPNEDSGTESSGVSYDENGNVILSDPPTYAEILALHGQDPDTYRDPGDLQPETQEIIRLEDGQWYQSFVASSYNCRFIFLSCKEVGGDDSNWLFAGIGSAENAFLYNAAEAMYDDPSGEVKYREFSVALRGTLAEGSEGYAYQLQLPDMLTVCVESSNGTCFFCGTEALAIPEAYASLFDGKTGEVVVTGVVMRDENGVFYLKNVELYP